MAAALARVDADEEVAALEDLRPLPQREQVVERDPDALLERPLVLAARREVRREQDSLAIDARQHLEHARDLAGRDALEVDAAVVRRARRIVAIAGSPSSHRTRRRRRAAPRSAAIAALDASRGRRRRWRRAAAPISSSCAFFLTHHGFGSAFDGAPPPVSRSHVSPNTPPANLSTSRPCRCCTSRYACSELTTNVRFRSFAACVTRWTCCSWNTSSTGASSCRIVRIRWPTSVIAAQSRMIVDLAELAQIVGERLDGGAVGHVLRRCRSTP